jgi:3-keto-disaccharide hydrolase
VKGVTEAVAIIVALFLLVVVGRTGEIRNPISKWDFERDAIDQSPRGFSFARTGSGRVGRWLVKIEKDVPGGTHVVAQVDSDSTSNRFPVAVVDTVSIRDFRLTVRCKPVSGKVDQACGLVFRYRDENNYYVVRANALENNVRLYYVLNGKRQQFAGWDGPVSNGVWHELRVDAKGDHFQIYWNGTKVMNASDRTFQEAGKVGVWTKADSITYFDDLSVQSLDPK